jgi:hypothetical protein
MNVYDQSQKRWLINNFLCMIFYDMCVIYHIYVYDQSQKKVIDQWVFLYDQLKNRHTAKFLGQLTITQKCNA